MYLITEIRDVCHTAWLFLMYTEAQAVSTSLEFTLHFNNLNVNSLNMCLFTTVLIYIYFNVYLNVCFQALVYFSFLQDFHFIFNLLLFNISWQSNQFPFEVLNYRMVVCFLPLSRNSLSQLYFRGFSFFFNVFFILPIK